MKWDKIKKIEKTKTKPIYHMTIEKNHNFFGNNLCLHNCDYHGNEKNYGNIAIAIRNDNPFPVLLTKGEKIAQGIFVKYLTTDDDESGNTRNGGIGSTN